MWRSAESSLSVGQIRSDDGLVEDQLQAMMDVVEARAAQTNRTQVMGWMSGALERAFTLRMRDIERSVKANSASRSGTSDADSRARRKFLGPRDRLRLERAVDRF